MSAHRVLLPGDFTRRLKSRLEGHKVRLRGLMDSPFLPREGGWGVRSWGGSTPNPCLHRVLLPGD